MRIGLAGSVVVGIVSALFGIGGGPIQVPFLVTVLNYPEHVATATSHAVLAATSLLATLIHALRGDFAADLPVTLSTAAGALIGAPIGARLSGVVSGRFLLRILAAMLLFIAVRLIFWEAPPWGNLRIDERSIETLTDRHHLPQNGFIHGAFAVLTSRTNWPTVPLP